MHKTLLLLGLLLQGPRSGYDIDRFLRTRGALYADLKKANVYYLLDRLAREGFLAVEAEPGARGPRRERLIYSLTERGRERFDELLREVLRVPETQYSGVGAAITFLDRLPRAQAIALLEERREAAAARRAELADLVELHRHLPLIELAMEHLLALVDADLTWTERALDRLEDTTHKAT